jgi:hypothetical protein
LIKRKIDEHPRRWHEVLSEALWAHRISCHGATKTLPYHLVYGQEAILPWEITADSRRIEFQNDLTVEEYAALMNDNVEDLMELRLWSLEKIKENKVKVACASQAKGAPCRIFGMGSGVTIGNQGRSLWKMESKLAWAL